MSLRQTTQRRVVVLATTTQHQRATYRVRLSREFDGEYRRQLRAEITAALACGSREFVVDCQSWDRIDLALLSVLIQCAKVCGDQQADFELVNVPHEVRSGIRALRLEHRLRLSA